MMTMRPYLVHMYYHFQPHMNHPTSVVSMHYCNSRHEDSRCYFDLVDIRHLSIGHFHLEHLLQAELHSWMWLNCLVIYWNIKEEEIMSKCNFDSTKMKTKNINDTNLGLLYKASTISAARFNKISFGNFSGSPGWRITDFCNLWKL